MPSVSEMEIVYFLAMVNSFDDATKTNLKKILYGDDGKCEASNSFDGPNKSMGFLGCGSRDSNPLCDEIKNEKAPDLQVEPIFDSYSGRDPMAHIKAFKMKFELEFGVNDNLMEKYFPTTLKGDALTWYFSLPSKSINCYEQLVSEFYIHFKHSAPRQVIVSNFVNTIC